MLGRLNIFQKSMLQWNEMHPYSAIHVVRIAGALDTARLRTCIHATVEQRGLTRLRMGAQDGTFQYEGGPANCEVQTLDAGKDTFGALVAEMQRQLNLPFAHSKPFDPFRFLIAPSGWPTNRYSISLRTSMNTALGLPSAPKASERI